MTLSIAMKNSKMDSYLKMMKHMADLYRQYETHMTDKRFSFDMELLLLTALHSGRDGSVVGRAPIVWVESNEESNFYIAQAGNTLST